MTEPAPDAVPGADAIRIALPDERATLAAGARLARALDHGAQVRGGSALTVFLAGSLGAGKTTFVRGVLRALGHRGPVRSPTYTLVEPYAVAGHEFFHFDLYRLADPEELELIGGRDLFGQAGALCFVEWPERGHGWLATADLEIEIRPAGGGRVLEAVARSARGGQLQASLGQSKLHC